MNRQSSGRSPTPQPAMPAPPSGRGSELRRQFVRFCENTTIRGIPRIVKSESPRLRLLWTVFVLMLFASCVVCLSFLIDQFLEYDVMHPPRVLKDASSPFPSLTICNMRPLSSRGKSLIKQRGWKNPRQFSVALEAAARRQYFAKAALRHKYHYFTGSFGLPAFLESLPSGQDSQLGHQLVDFIVDCKAVLRNGSARNQYYCSEEFAPGPDDLWAGRFHAFVHGSFLNCFTLDIDESLRQNTALVEMAVYLDNEWSPEHFYCTDCYLQDINTQLSGAVLTIHAGDTHPDVNNNAVHLKSGSLTEVKLKHELNVQKQPPYGRCSADTAQSLQLQGRKYSYSEDACRQMTIQMDIRASCGCQAIEYPLVPEEAGTNITYCAGLPEFLPLGACIADGANSSSSGCEAALDRAYGHIRCKQAVISKYSKDVVPSCSMPCAFYSYQTERSTSDWPTKSWQLHLLQSRVYQRLQHRPEMRIYAQAIELERAGRLDSAFQLVQNVSILERNLLSIQLIRPNFDLHRVEEKEVLSLTSFLSQVGGLLSIFVGLTMIFIVELIDFLVHCCGVYAAARRGGGSDSGENSGPPAREVLDLIDAGKPLRPRDGAADAF